MRRHLLGVIIGALVISLSTIAILPRTACQRLQSIDSTREDRTLSIKDKVRKIWLYSIKNEAFRNEWDYELCMVKHTLSIEERYGELIPIETSYLTSFPALDYIVNYYKDKNPSMAIKYCHWIVMSRPESNDPYAIYFSKKAVDIFYEISVGGKRESSGLSLDANITGRSIAAAPYENADKDIWKLFTSTPDKRLFPFEIVATVFYKAQKQLTDPQVDYLLDLAAMNKMGNGIDYIYFMSLDKDRTLKEIQKRALKLSSQQIDDIEKSLVNQIKLNYTVENSGFLCGD